MKLHFFLSIHIFGKKILIQEAHGEALVQQF